MAETPVAPPEDLQVIADRIRRHPELARELNVSALAQEVAGRWREHSDMLQASEEIPVAAWIVKKKVEGLIRPDDPEPETPGFDLALRPEWLEDAVSVLRNLEDSALMRWGRVGAPLPRPPAPVKDPSPWKLSWSYPTLRPKPAPLERRVAREPEPLSAHIETLYHAVCGEGRVKLQQSLTGRSRPEWVATFLAAVHLWHARRVQAEQGVAFGPIDITLPDGGQGS